MSFYAFRLLSPVAQLHYVLTHGTYLAQCWEAEGGVNLYHLPDEDRGFFAEVGYDACQHGAVVLSGFSSKGPLETYACWIRLPEQ